MTLPHSIAVVRHGETDWNLARRIQGRTEVPLNETGRGQAAATADLLREAGDAAGGAWLRVLTSPLGRAVETAAIIARRIGAAGPTIDEALWERDFGPAEGLEVGEAHARWPGLDIPSAEPLRAVAERSSTALARILDASPGSVVVAHGAMLRAGLGAFADAPVPRILNGEVWILGRAPGSERIRAERLDALRPAATPRRG